MGLQETSHSRWQFGVSSVVVLLAIFAVIGLANPLKTSANQHTADASATQLEWTATSPDGALVTLNGSLSTGDIDVYHWVAECIHEPCADIWLNEFGDQTSPITDVSIEIGTYLVTLVTASLEPPLEVHSEPILIVVSAVIPVADAGVDHLVDATWSTGAEITLDGSGSTNADTYSWAIGDTEISTSATLDHEFPIGITTVTLTVTSVSGNEDTDEVVITVMPVANAGPDITVDSTTPGAGFATLDGRASFGNVIGWNVDSVSIGTDAVLVDRAFPILITTVELVVGGPDGLEDYDYIVVTIRPVANAGSDREALANTATSGPSFLAGYSSFHHPESTWVWTDSEDNVVGTEIFVTIPDVPMGANEYTVTLTGPDGQASSDSIIITVVQPPVSAFATETEWTATSANGALVTLDGSLSSQSFDLYEWRENCVSFGDCSDPIILVEGAPDALVADAQLAVGSHNVTLWAFDGDQWLPSPTITIIVDPVADAGEDQRLFSSNGVDANVTLDGSASIGATAFFWYLDEELIVEGEIVQIDLPVGVHTVTLSAEAPGLGAATDAVIITVEDLPVADAGEDQTVRAESEAGTMVTLDGSGSYSQEPLSIIAWEWSIDGDSIANTEVADVLIPPGTWTVTLTVTDDYSRSNTDEVVITVTVPVAVAPSDETVTATSADGALVELDGSASFGDIVSWVWSTDDNPDLGEGEIASVLVPVGVNAITLTVTDSEDRTDTATVTITVVLPVGEPGVELSIARTTVGSTVGFSIEYFQPETDVVISIIRGDVELVITTISTDAIGAATGSFQVPPVPGGVATIRFSQDQTEIDQALEIAPRIMMASASVPPGSLATVNVTGFQPGDTARIRWKIGTTFQNVGELTVNADGAGSVAVVVPANAAAGPNTVRAESPGGNAQTNAANVVFPNAMLDPERTTVNNWVQFSIEGFPAEADVLITWRRPGGSTVVIDTIQTNANGEAEGQFRVPATEGGNLNRVTFISGATSFSQAFDVAPRIKVTPAVVAQSEQVDVSLRGYGKQETVLIRWRINGVWIAVATVTTSNTGSANVLITVPANAEPGPNAIRGDGPLNRQQTNAVEVIAPPLD